MLTDRETAEQVLSPGNLVYGGDLDDFESYLQHGIKTPSGVNRRTDWSTSGNICLAMLSKEPFPSRYSFAKHFGPKDYCSGIMKDLGIIISGSQLKEHLKGQIFAIGETFWDPKYTRAERSLYEVLDDIVYGFPIRTSYGLKNSDEVRVYPDDPLSVSIPQALWRGITIPSSKFPDRLKQLDPNLITNSLPVLSEKCVLLARDLREVLS